MVVAASQDLAPTLHFTLPRSLALSLKPKKTGRSTKGDWQRRSTSTVPLASMILPIQPSLREGRHQEEDLPEVLNAVRRETPLGSSRRSGEVANGCLKALRSRRGSLLRLAHSLLHHSRFLMHQISATTFTAQSLPTLTHLTLSLLGSAPSFMLGRKCRVSTSSTQETMTVLGSRPLLSLRPKDVNAFLPMDDQTVLSTSCRFTTARCRVLRCSNHVQLPASLGVQRLPCVHLAARTTRASL